MKWISFIAAILLLLMAAGYAQSQLVHFPVNSAIEGQDIQLEARLENVQSRVVMVRIYYKLPEENSYRYTDMQPDINRWTGIIPGSDVKGERLEYFINALLGNQQILTFPQYNPYNQPEEIQIFPPRQPIQKSAGKRGPSDFLKRPEPQEQVIETSNVETPLLLLSPEPNEIVLETEVLFAVSLSGGDQEVDPASVQIFLDGKNITKICQISEFMATFEPKRLPQGQHWFKVVAKTVDGKPIEPLVVNFTVGAEAALAVERNFRGHAFADLRDETINEVPNSFNMTGGDFSGRYGVLQYSGKFLVSSLEDPNFQPRNRYSFSLKTKVLGVEGGDVYPRMNDLILWGKRVRGVSGYVHLGFINVDAVMGESYRGIEGIGSGSGASAVISSYGTFAQKLIGIRPSFGSGRNFQFGLSLVKIIDDTTSIKYGTLPKDNIIVGPDLKLTFDRGRITLNGSGAFSLLTNNIYGGAMTTAEIEDITGEPLDLPVKPEDIADYIIINDSTIPIDPTKRTSMAYNVKLTLRYLRNILQVGYKSIGAQYMSLANPWIRKDIEGFYFNDRLRLFKNRLYLNFGYEDFVDSFSEFSPNPALDLKTFNYGFSIYPGKGYPNITVSLKNHVRNNNINQLELTPLSVAAAIDTFDNREKSLHRDLSVQLNYNLNLFALDHSLFVNYISSNFVDDFSTSRSYSQEYSTDMRMFTLTTKYQIPLKTTINFATNSNLSAGGSNKFEYNMYGLVAEYEVWRNKASAFAEYRGTNSRSTIPGNQSFTFGRSHFRIGGIGYLGVRHTVTLDANLISYSTPVATGGTASYSDRIIRLRWEMFF